MNTSASSVSTAGPSTGRAFSTGKPLQSVWKGRLFQTPGAGLIALMAMVGPLSYAGTVSWTAASSTSLPVATNWSTAAAPLTSDEAVFTSVPNTNLTSGNTLTWGDLVWNTNTSASMAISSAASGSRLFTLSGGGGSNAAIAAGGSTGDLIVLGDNATSSTLLISGQTNAGGFTIKPTLGANGNFNVKNSGATLQISASIFGDFALTKTGTGALTLSAINFFGATNTFTVSAGTVNADNNRALGSGNVALSGGELVINSTGTGTLTLQADKSFSMTTGTLKLSIASAASFDQIFGSGTGTFNLSGGVIDLTNSVTDYGVTYSFFSGFSSGSVSGLTFTNYDSATYTAILGSNGLLSFTLNSIPEPSTYAAILGGLALGFVAWRRRRG